MAEEKEGGTITLKKQDLWKYSTFALIAVVVIGLIIISGGPNSGSVTAPTGTTGQPSVNAQSLIENNDPVLGDPNAPVSIIEFSDFECPFCQRAHFDALAQFKASNYFTSGQVNFVYKHFPLSSIHPKAQIAAEASLCAQEQDAFWEYHDTLFENQADWVNGGESSLKSYASQLGLNTQQFNSCLDGGKYTSEVNKELQQATAAGGRGTPFFVIINKDTGDAVPVSGAVPWSSFEPALLSVL